MLINSIPNLRMIFKLNEISAFIDDFSYYIYHNITYGE
jgi:hypothetical protein